MRSLPQSLEQYLALRRAMGFRLKNSEVPLRKFVAFMERERAPFITARMAARWAKHRPEVKPVMWSIRLRMVRGFAKFLAASDPRTEIPSPEIFPASDGRRPPRIFSSREVLALIKAAAGLRSRVGLRPMTIATLIGLLASTGLRHGEALRLQRPDVDLANGVLTVRQTKFDKTRLVPLHPSTAAALRSYSERRDKLVPRSCSSSFLVKDDGRPYGICGTRFIFVQLCEDLALRGEGARFGPRLHDLRHTFVVRTLIDWYRRGVDVEARMPWLATYLGHSDPAHTYWYFSNVPELVGAAGQLVWNQAGGAS